jgi:hypothetical protein
MGTGVEHMPKARTAARSVAVKERRSVIYSLTKERVAGEPRNPP